MKLLSHIIIGILVLLILYLLKVVAFTSLFSAIVALLVVSLASILPDIDVYLDEVFPKRTVKIENGRVVIIRNFRFHRKALHNIFVPLIFLVAYYLSYFGILPRSWLPYTFLFFLGTLLHIMCDALTPLGVYIVPGHRVRGKMRTPKIDLLVILILIIIIYFLVIL